MVERLANEVNHRLYHQTKQYEQAEQGEQQSAIPNPWPKSVPRPMALSYQLLEGDLNRQEGKVKQKEYTNGEPELAPD